VRIDRDDGQLLMIAKVSAFEGNQAIFVSGEIQEDR